ncbi:galactinol synthase 2 [Perilla frutescens var. hirtella]|uniref:Hexosyltransferase n=1 Tax=Perilla frutescens var. hirtella TaxID=608512 RepID=A0AAD4IRV4_PERFH|nr:galactinol synthase 2 [Perilla frutescens var. hirtella]
MAPEIVKSTVGNGAAPVIPAATHAYVTFLGGDGDYVKGVVGLAKGLRKVGAAFPLVVAVLPDVPAEHRRLLVEQGCLLREIEAVFPPPAAAGSESPYVRSYFVLNYCKLRLWELVEYEKMIYMDADIQVFDNIDHLFDLPSGYLYGVVDCLCEMYGQPCSEKLRWPKELGPEPSFYLNGGMFMLEPNLTTYHQLINTLAVTPPTPFAEQDFLNMFFRDNMKPLPPIYNLLVAMLWRHPEAVNVEEAKVVHYCVAGSKPWRYTGEGERMDRPDIKMLVRKWWDIYNDVSLDFMNHHHDQRPIVATVFPDGKDGKNLATSAPEVVVLYRSASSAA